MDRPPCDHQYVRPWERALKEMRESRNPSIQEDAFHLLRAQAAELVVELRTAYEAETDHGAKCWLLELLGEARDPSLEDLFESALAGPDESLRHWAEWGLRNLDSKTARRVLWRHSHDEETSS
jgi:hypothetical protein